jgi:hypothetical protein
MSELIASIAADCRERARNDDLITKYHDWEIADAVHSHSGDGSYHAGE